MVVLLIVLAFAVMLVIDHLFLRQPIVIEAAPEMANAPARQPLVGGFDLRKELQYHPGHTWAAAEATDRVRVGVDDFAVKFAGKATAVDVPERGQWIRQGQKIISIHRDGADLELVSPIEGTVVDINDKVLLDPDTVRRDPYGDGWLLVVNSPDAKTNFRNLLSGNVARRWLDESAARLRAAVAGPALITAQEGGVAVGNVLDTLPADQWQKLEKELFLV